MLPGMAAFANAIDPDLMKNLRDELLSAGATVAGFSSHLLSAAGGTPNSRPASLILGLGKLYLLNARLSAVDKLPALEQEFECAAHSDDFNKLKGTGTVPQQLRYLGLLLVR
jgi:hypothetical protein